MLKYTIVKRVHLMKPINKETLKLAADKVMLSIEDEEYDSLLVEIQDIIKQLQAMDDIEGINEVEPMTFPFDVKVNYLREDISEEPLSREDVLKNSRDIEDGQIRLPKVVK